MKRHEVGSWYSPVNGQVRLLGFTDDAFKAQDDEGSGLALWGLAVLLSFEILQAIQRHHQDKRRKPILLDWISRRLKRFVRSTFAAERDALIKTIEPLMVLQLALHQCCCGTIETAETLLIKMEEGQLYPPIDMVIHARSVLDAIAASEACTLAEASLRLHLITIRERMTRGLSRSLS